MSDQRTIWIGGTYQQAIRYALAAGVSDEIYTGKAGEHAIVTHPEGLRGLHRDTKIMLVGTYAYRSDWLEMGAQLDAFPNQERL